jgi:TRAP-type C4-dicarboxylate transport system permease small subunit
MIFVGAVIGVRKNTHLGVDMFVLALPIVGRKICWVICQSLMIVCSVYMLYGTWMQHHIISANSSAVMRISLLWVYGISYLTGTVISLICIAKLVRFALGQIDDSEFIENPATDSGASSGPGELDTDDSARQEGPRT